MELPVDRWYEALHHRHSWRSYQEIPVEAEKLYRLREVCARLSGPGARAKIVSEDIEGVFRGFIASYGKVTGAPAYAAFIGDTRDPNMFEKAGWLGEESYSKRLPWVCPPAGSPPHFTRRLSPKT